jgi:hypothetical protein
VKHGKTRPCGGFSFLKDLAYAKGQADGSACNPAPHSPALREKETRHPAGFLLPEARPSRIIPG